MNVKEEISEINEDALFADGFDDAIIGIAVGGPNMNDVVVYDYEKCIEVLISRDGMSYSDAMEYMDYNVVGAYVGENTPMFVNTDVVK